MQHTKSSISCVLLYSHTHAKASDMKFLFSSVNTTLILHCPPGVDAISTGPLHIELLLQVIHAVDCPDGEVKLPAESGQMDDHITQYSLI